MTPLSFSLVGMWLNARQLQTPHPGEVHEVPVCLLCRDKRYLIADRAPENRSSALIHAVRTDWALRTARLAPAQRGGHVRAEQLLKETAQRVAVQPSCVFGSSSGF